MYAQLISAMEHCYETHKYYFSNCRQQNTVYVMQLIISFYHM